MLNPFFQQGSKTEQSLVQDLINEQLKIYGVEIHYLPRFYITEKTVMREVVESRFDSSYPIEAYVQNVDGYGDNPTILSKFGIESTNEITLVISKERFNDYISPLIKNEPNVKLSSRPKEGDLLYFPLGDRLFEIKYVEHEKPFYQLQENYVYELRCELFQYEDEIIDTGVSEIDDLLEGVEGVDGEEIFVGRTQTLTLVGAGVTAEAITSIVDGGIRLITVNNRGGGYTSPPRVAISRSPGGPTGIASAVLIGGIVACNKNLSSNEKSVQSVQILNAGSGYTTTPKVQFFSSSGVGAAATATLGDGIIGIVTVTDGGGGYVDSPTINFTSPVGPGAAATVTVSAAGTVTAVTIDNGGAYYNPNTPPEVTFSTPSDRINGVTSINPSSPLPQGSNFTSGVYTTTNASVGATGTGLTLDVTVNESGAVTAVEIADPGQNYANGNVVNITNGQGGASGTVSFAVVTAENIDGVTATGIATVSSAGVVTSVSITNAGVGYYSGATVSIANTSGNKTYGGGLNVAIGTAIVSAAGSISEIRITNAGLGYTVAPTIVIGDPSTSGVGTFAFNETITGSVTGATARVRKWNANTSELEISNIVGAFSSKETVTGGTSGASYEIRIVDRSLNDGGFNDNDDIESEADAIIDFEESNPFGVP